MRILLDYRPALRDRTGIGEYAHELARALVATAPGRDEHLTLFSASWKDRLDPHVIPGAAVVDRRLPNRLLNAAWHRLGWPAVETLTGLRLDVAQAFHPLLIPAARAAQVVTVADLDFLDHPERTVREIRRDYPTLAPRHARRAHHVITISRATAGEIERRLGVPASRITVCTPGAPAWARRAQEPPSGCLLFLGTLEPRKNLGTLLDAYERLIARRPSAPPLVLAGRVTDAASALLARIGRPPLVGRVELPGYVDDEARQALYRRALVFLLPSHTEGFGMPVLEAMTIGVPVIVANRGALPEVAGPAGRYIDPDDPAGLCAAMDDLIAAPAARQAMRDAGWQQARGFDWRHSAERLREAWAAAVAVRRAAGG